MLDKYYLFPLLIYFTFFPLGKFQVCDVSRERMGQMKSKALPFEAQDAQHHP
jgi:hypothetical protein